MVEVRRVGGAYVQPTLVEHVGRRNLPGTLAVTGALEQMLPLMDPAARVVVTDGDDVVLVGPVTGWSATQAQGSDRWTATVTAADDLIWLWGRMCYPVPSAAWESQTSATDTRSGPAETVVLGYIAANAAANPSRAALPVSVPASGGRGATITKKVRFTELGALVAGILETQTLRIAATDGGIQIVDTPDLSAWARYGTYDAGGPGVATEASYTVTRPTVTHARVAGNGTGASRVLRSRSDADAAALWGVQIEMYIDQRQTDSTAEMDQAGDDALSEGAAPITVSATLSDHAGLALGLDVPLGALIGLDLPGLSTVERVRSITTTWSPERVTRTGTVGPADGEMSRDQKMIRAMARSLRRMEMST